MNPRNLTREAIEELNDIEPYCFETDREEQWFNVGLKHGLDVADSDPISSWISVEEDLPCNHVELLVDCFQTKYVEACFTHSDGSSFVTIVKMVRVDVGIGKDCWTWSSNLREHVTYWKPIPEPPKE